MEKIIRRLVPSLLRYGFHGKTQRILMERFHQKLMEVMLVIRLTYAGNKLVELMHLNARVAKPNLSSSSKKENSFF